MMVASYALAASLLLASSVTAVPGPVPAPTPTAPFARRGEVSSLVSSATGFVASALPTVLGSWPSLDDIKKKLDISDSDAEKIPPSAILIPSYANHTDQGWNMRFYGLIYRQANTSSSDLASLINGLKTDNLNSTEQSLLQNRTQELAALPISKANVTAIVTVNNKLVTNSSGIPLMTADDFGEFDEFTVVPNVGQTSDKAQIVHTAIYNLTGPGNATTILAPNSGISIVSDIDDVLRVTKVYVPNQGLFNSFVEPYVNEMGVPELFEHWNKTLPGVAFHYDTTTPVQLTRTYVDYLFANYPLGSLEMRPINLTEPSQVLDARQNSLLKLFQTFPQRKFVLVGDTSSSTLLSAYPQIAQQFPNQLACIFIRNTSATDPEDKIPYSTKEFQNVNNTQYFFYRDPQDLMGLDIAGGECVNKTIPQNVTFGEQGGVLDDGHGKSAATVVGPQMAGVVVAAMIALLAL